MNACICISMCVYIVLYNTDECPENCVLFCDSDGIEVTMTCYQVKLIFKQTMTCIMTCTCPNL